MNLRIYFGLTFWPGLTFGFNLDCFCLDAPLDLLWINFVAWIDIWIYLGIIFLPGFTFGFTLDQPFAWVHLWIYFGLTFWPGFTFGFTLD